MNRRARILLILAALLVLADVSQAQMFGGQKRRDYKYTPDENQQLLEEVWTIVDRRFYARDKNGVDWPAMKDKYLPRARKAGGRQEVYEVINSMLGELGASHTVLISGEVYTDHFAPEMTGMMGFLQRLMGGNRSSGGSKLQAGFEMVDLGGKYFVRTVLDGHPAKKAGLRAGDEVVSVNKTSIAKSGLLLFAGGDTHIKNAARGYYLRLPSGADPFDVGVRRRKGGAVRSVTVTPKKMNMVDATRNSVKIVRYGDRARIGYVHTWHFLSNDITTIVRDAIRSFNKSDCDALILDLRGRGGSPQVITAILNMVSGRRAIWKKPVVCLQDENSRSAKEIFAHEFKTRKAGILVGRRTEGAVLGSQFIPLSDGSYLLLAMVGGTQFSSDGANLEGNGVRPHIRVESTLEYSHGDDPIYARGLAVASAYAKWAKKSAAADKSAVLPLGGDLAVLPLGAAPLTGLRRAG